MADWNPWQTLEALRREIDRVYNENGSRSEPFSRAAFLPGRAARRYPLINLYEDKEAVYVEALAPGVDQSTLNLSVHGNTLSIAGEKRRVAGSVQPVTVDGQITLSTSAPKPRMRVSTHEAPQ